MEMPESEVLRYADNQEAQMIDFIQKCLVIDPRLRITPEEAYKHPFIANCLLKRPISSS